MTSPIPKLPSWVANTLYTAAGIAVIALVAGVIQMRIELAVIAERVRNIEATVARIENRQTGKPTASGVTMPSIALKR